MTSPRPLDKDLYALRHRAQELSKGVAKTMQQLMLNKSDWSNVWNECSVISSQLMNIQNDIEKGIGSQLNKFTLQPSHGHFDFNPIGVQKMPQIVEDTNKYYTDGSSKWIREYDESEILNQLNNFNKMLSRLDLFNSICIAQTKNDENVKEDKDGDGDEKMKVAAQQNEKMQRKHHRYLVEFVFCGQTPEQRARMASNDSSDDEMH